MTTIARTMTCEAVIDGETVTGPETFDDLDPATGELLAGLLASTRTKTVAIDLT